MSSRPGSIPPLRQRSHTRNIVRAVLLACIVGGLLVPLYFFGMAEMTYFAWDFRAYYTAAEAALHGRPFVGIETDIPGVSYVYPPISVVLFVPQTAAGGWKLAFALQTLLNVCMALALAALTIRTIEARRARLASIDRLLIIGFCLGTAPAVAVFGQGQVDMLIALALAGAFVALERGKQGLAGVVLAGASLVKVFPAALGLWLVWRRAWRGVVAALVTGLAGLALGWVWFGLDAYWRYLDVLASRSRLAEFAGTVSPNFFAMSLHRPLSQLLPQIDPDLYLPLSVLVVAPSLALVTRRERGVSGRLTTYLVAIIAMLLVSPASNALYVVYAYFPILTLLYLDAAGRAQSLLLAGIVTVAFPVQPAQIATALTMAGVPDPLRSQLLFVAREVLTVASLPLLGLVTILTWATLRAMTSQRAATPERRPARAD
mgnify:CR=1 FL=1